MGGIADMMWALASVLRLGCGEKFNTTDALETATASSL
jgi:hypothetical protein